MSAPRLSTIDLGADLDVTLQVISKCSPPDLIDDAIRAHHAWGLALHALAATLVENKSEEDLRNFLSMGGEIVRVIPAGHQAPSGGFLGGTGFDRISTHDGLSLENDPYLKNFNGPVLGCFSSIPAPGTGRFGTRNNAYGMRCLSEQRRAMIIGNVLCENKIVASQMSRIQGVVIRLQLNPYREIPEWVFARRPDALPPYSNYPTTECFKGLHEIEKNFDAIQVALRSGEVIGLVSHHGTHLTLVPNPIGT